VLPTDTLRVVVAAGASGGHVYPALATAEVLRDQGHAVEFVGGDRLEARVIPEAGFAFHPLPVPRPPSVRREILSPRGVRTLGAFVSAARRARGLLQSLDPDVVVSMGGFAAVPVGRAAGRMGLPLVLHEQNANLSLAQRLVRRRANLLALGLPLSGNVGGRLPSLVVGNPVRGSIVAIGGMGPSERRSAALGARKRLGLEPGRPTLLVMGGSLSSGPLNADLPQVDLPPEVQVLHLAGDSMEDDVRNAYQEHPNPVRVVGYVEDMEDVYLAADLAVCRSGAITVAELAVAGLPSVLVPLETLRRGDQEANARVLERAGGARVLLGSEPSFLGRLTEEVSHLLSDTEALREMSSGARSVARPRAALDLADAITSCARNEGRRPSYP
jgi:UDP-N-acetylglucosamine--N-acetylmuramyl-(pentapeptide) pyrophosphoryl-undecaprenol N-acetylglucosamine transferase